MNLKKFLVLKNNPYKYCEYMPVTREMIIDGSFTYQDLKIIIAEMELQKQMRSITQKGGSICRNCKEETFNKVACDYCGTDVVEGEYR